MVRFGVAALASLIVPLAGHLGLSQWLGAHPWWAVQIAWIGAPAGYLLAILIRNRAALPGLLALAAATGAGFAAAAWGKARFAASFADDALAGQIWYFGWIATATCAAALLAFAALSGLRRGG